MSTFNKLLTALGHASLPGQSAHKEMSFTDRIFDAPKNAIPSVVTILLLEKEHRIVFPLIKRTSSSSHHKSQIALPGGRLDINETKEDAALRELNEEIGALPNTIEVIQHLTPLYIPVSNHLVYPLIAFSKTYSNFKISPNEVEYIIELSITDLIALEKDTAKVLLTQNRTIDAPCFKYNNEIIWGATCLILNEFRIMLNSISE